MVHADETSWSINSVWAFLSEKARLLLFGVHQDAAALLDPATFAGLVISDDAAVYANFTQAQKCWAHLLRKAIKLTLQDAENADYRRFADRLLEIYREATRLQKDGRFSDSGRTRRVALLEDEVFELSGKNRSDSDRIFTKISSGWRTCRRWRVRRTITAKDRSDPERIFTSDWSTR